MPVRCDSTVIVCTRDRSGLLAKTCESLLGLDDCGLAWELVVVDNASSDNTREVALSLRQRCEFSVRVVREETVGLSAARNAGIRAARGRIIAFLDDDALPNPRWLSALVDVLGRDEVYAAGGPVEPRFRSELPSWFSDRFLPYLTVWDLGPEVVRLRYNEYPRGANMAFRREAFDRFGLFSPHLGRKARSLLSCEEIEFCLRIERGGGVILYTPAARVAHLVEGGRVTKRWLIQRFHAQGTSEAIVEWQHLGFAGLTIGARRSLKKALLSSRTEPRDDGIVGRCERAACRGYLVGVMMAPMTVPRYRPAPEAGPAAPWRPFA